MNILWKSVLYRYQFGKYCTLRKGKMREPVKCLAEIQAHMSPAFFLSPALVILSKKENELGLA